MHATRRRYPPHSVAVLRRASERRSAIPICIILIALVPATKVFADGLGGGGPIEQEQCVSSAVWQQIVETVRENQRNQVQVQRSDIPPPLFTFYPVGGRLYRDLFTHNFVDLNPAPVAHLDWDCTDFTYDGHDASDVHIRSFGEQLIGVPVFAALDGRVAALYDGCNDMNTCPFAPCAHCVNYVALDNGFGRVTYYLHLRKNSVTLGINQQVRAGETIGLVGSSGLSSSPHLHFATYDQEVVFEPYAGPCRDGASGWENQTAIRRDFYLRDMGLTYEDMNYYPGYPHVFPRSGQIALTDPRIYIWALPINLPAGSTWRFRIQRPDGSTVLNTGNMPFSGGNNPFLRASWWWWSFDVPQMHTTTGTWIVRFDINGIQRAALPVEVVEVRSPEFNRPPNPISVFLQPSDPSVNDVLVCGINTDLVMDDPDYDIVRYHYVWTSNDVVVRDIVSAGHADVLSHQVAAEGETVVCTVTPSDGIAEGATSSASVTLCISPIIEQHPTGTALCEGEEWIFSASGSGSPPLAFQWRRNGKVIPDAVGTTLLVVASAETAGDYDVVLTNPCTSVVSAPATLEVTTYSDCDDGDDCTQDICMDAECAHEATSGNPCDDGELCTGYDTCDEGICLGEPIVLIFADIAPPPYGDGMVEIQDIICLLEGYLDPTRCPRADIAPCGGDGIIEVADVLILLDAYFGLKPCPDPCPA